MQDISYASGKELERQFSLRDELLVKINNDLESIKREQKTNQLWLRRLADVVGLDANGNRVQQYQQPIQQPIMPQRPVFEQPNQEYLHPSIEIDNSIPEPQDLPVPQPMQEEKKSIFGGLFKKKEEPLQPIPQQQTQPKQAPIQQQKRTVINKKPEDMTDEELRLHVFGE